MDDPREIERKIKHAVDLQRRMGAPEFRLVAFERYLRAGNRARAFRILVKNPICGARRPNGQPCLASPKYHGRCKWHGGGALVMGPRTQEGRERIRQAALRRWARFRAERAAQSTTES